MIIFTNYASANFHWKVTWMHEWSNRPPTHMLCYLCGFKEECSISFNLSTFCHILQSGGLAAGGGEGSTWGSSRGGGGGKGKRGSLLSLMNFIKTSSDKVLPQVSPHLGLKKKDRLLWGLNLCIMIRKAVTEPTFWSREAFQVCTALDFLATWSGALVRMDDQHVCWLEH